MPTIPKEPRTISQLLPSQLPDYIQEDYPMFIAFLKAYYEWLETNGTQVYEGKILATTLNTVTLANPASTEINGYQNMYIACLNGPAKGYTRKIKTYDPATRIATLTEVWEQTNLPPANTKMEIRDASSPEKLLEYRDIDFTLDRFIDYFRDEFMYKIPGNILADERNILKHIKQFYQAKGTENSFRFIFRILFNEEVEFYYPKVDLFRASDARWFTQKIMKITTTDKTFDYKDRRLVGVFSGSSAKVESVTQQLLPHGTVTTLTLSSLDGQFTIDPNTGKPEQVKIVYPVPPPPQTDLGSVTDLLEPFNQLRYEQAYQLLQNLVISTPGNNYQIGEFITIDGGGSLSPATAIITSIFQTYYNGACSVPPSVFYLEPYFGPNDTVNTTSDFTQDGVCIPGMYYFSDVHSTYTDADLLNSTQIMLSLNETTIDNFFVGDEIALVAGTGTGERRTIVSYNGTTKIATVDVPYSVIPDGTTQYSITHVRGGIKSIKIVDFGLGFVTTPTVTIHTALGSGAVLPPALGLVATTAGQWTAGRDGGIGELPTSPDSFASSNKIIQDSFYWQDFSYDLRFGETVDKYRDVVKGLLHPAGLKMFGSVLLKSKPETKFLNLLRYSIIQLEAKHLSLCLTTSEQQISHNLRVDSPTAVVVGTKNKDFDWMKFFAFPPTVSWNILYPYPNENYWSPWGPGNTQINNYKDRTIASFVNFPDQRTKINADANIQIQSAQTTSVVGPVGQSRAAISQFRFVGFPPFEGFDEIYPNPNHSYWTTYGNTQIGNLQTIVLSDLIVDPQLKHSNICVDSNLQVFVPGSIPTIGNQIEYDFLEGFNSQIVYNVSPNSSGDGDAVLGNTSLVESIDGTWINEGVQLTASGTEIVNATGVPMNLTECTVIVVAMCPNISAGMSLVNCVSSPTDNGFSIDLQTNGGISFRAQNGGSSKDVTFPTGTVKNGNFFMAALRFQRGKLSGNVSNRRSVSTTFPNYPSAPTTNTTGWYFGRETTDYTPTSQSASLFSMSLYGKNQYEQAGVSGSPVPIGYFNGTLSYAVFYDRALYDFELDSVYTSLRARLLTERGIILHDTTAKSQSGATRIQHHAIVKNQVGGFYIVKRSNQIGAARVRRRQTLTQIGTSNVYGTVLQGITGITAIRGGNFQTQISISRIRTTTKPTLSGTSRLRSTILWTQFGTSTLNKRTAITQTGTTNILVMTNQTSAGKSRIQKTAGTQTQTSVSRIQTTHSRTQTGIASVYKTEQIVQTGNGRIQLTSLQVQSGVSKLAIERSQTQTGVSRIRKTGVVQTMAGVANIT